MPTDEHKLQAQLIIGNFLRWGVFTAAAIVIIGGCFYLSQYGLQQAKLSQFIGVPQALTEVDTIISHALLGNGKAVIQAGLLVLILIPVVRVILSIFIFMFERDWTYVGITVVVLSLLLFSLISGSG